jgi:hypothetical protein
MTRKFKTKEEALAAAKTEIDSMIQQQHKTVFQEIKSQLDRLIGGKNQ